MTVKKTDHSLGKTYGNAEQRTQINRWKRILDAEDPKLLWHAIDWKGEYDPRPQLAKPTEFEFQAHIERLLNPPDAANWPEEVSLRDYNTSIPFLDEPFTLDEMQKTIDRDIKPKKGAGPDGIGPGFLHLLPAKWLMFLLSLLNTVFVTVFPTSWTPAKLVMLFKKGCPLDCGNYRGIAIINCFAKLYDYLLNHRLMKWYSPCREQAGAQAKRGCIEHIMSLRLLFEYCKRSNKKLFVVFVDFSKAYDRVPRGKLFVLLKSLGCGVIMLSALIAMYTVNTCFLGSTVIATNIGVRQGAPTSCFLFILFVDVLIKMIKSCGNDSFLEWFSVLMLMDDTVILATSRDMLLKRLNQLHVYCNEYGMVINEKKTELMVINGKPADMRPITLGQCTIKACVSYVYLGAVFTANGSALSSLYEHIEEKSKHLNRLLVFLATNYDAPFLVKRRVFEAAFSSAILYGCETWIDVNLKPIETMYMRGVKALLGVRRTTPNELCLIEAGLPSVRALIKKKQVIFIQKIFKERALMADDPLWFMLQLIAKSTCAKNIMLYREIIKLRDMSDALATDAEHLKESVRTKAHPNSDATRFKTYLYLNPTLTSHSIYSTNHVIPDNLRIELTRLRLSSHSLRVEMGRWSRTPRELRYCSCDNESLQDEEHLFTCPLTRGIREAYNCGHLTLFSLFDEVSTNSLIMLKKSFECFES